MKRLARLAILGILSTVPLSACSEGAPTSAYCDGSSSWTSIDGMAALAPSEDAVQQAMAGDMTGMREWGDSASDTIEAIVSDLKRAKDAAPTDEAARALDDLIEGVGMMGSALSAAGAASDLASLFEEFESIETQINAVDAKMNAATDVLERTYAEFCK